MALNGPAMHSKPRTGCWCAEAEVICITAKSVQAACRISGLGVHGVSVQNHGESQMPAGISPVAQGNDGMPAVGGSSNDVMTTLVYMSKVPWM